jgi:hypothetical protein
MMPFENEYLDSTNATHRVRIELAAAMGHGLIGVWLE